MGTDFIRLLARSAESQALEINRVLFNRLEPKQIVGLGVTDGATLELKTCEIVGVDNWCCVDHRLHNVVSHALDASAAMIYYSAAIEGSRAVSKSGALKLDLELAQLELGMDPKRVVTFSKTRWAHVYLVAERYLKLWEPLVLLGADGRFNEYAIESEAVPWKNSEARGHLEACQKVLSVFAKGIKQLEGQKYCTLCHVPRWIHRFLDILDADLENEVAADFQKCIKEQLEFTSRISSRDPTLH